MCILTRMDLSVCSILAKTISVRSAVETSLASPAVSSYAVLIYQYQQVFRIQLYLPSYYDSRYLGTRVRRLRIQFSEWNLES